MLDINLDENTVLTVIVVLVVLYLVYKKKMEKWTMLAGAPQKWGPLDYPAEPTRCDADFDDEKCKYAAVNCMNNPHSYFYMNE
jgi:hypothetical protein